MRLLELRSDHGSFQTIRFNSEGLTLIVGDGSKDKKEGSQIIPINKGVIMEVDNSSVPHKIILVSNNRREKIMVVDNNGRRRIIIDRHNHRERVM